MNWAAFHETVTSTSSPTSHSKACKPIHGFVRRCPEGNSYIWQKYIGIRKYENDIQKNQNHFKWFLEKFSTCRIVLCNSLMSIYVHNNSITYGPPYDLIHLLLTLTASVWLVPVSERCLCYLTPLPSPSAAQCRKVWLSSLESRHEFSTIMHSKKNDHNENNGQI